MADRQVFRLRVVFCKRGRLCLLSHLEIARALERAVRRAHLPFAVTQGFSPHMKIAFGAALPVGVGGTSEIFDVYLTRYVSATRAFDALRAASVPDLEVLSCEYVEPHAPAASIAFPLSTYRATFSYAPNPHLFVVPDEIRVVRKKKERVLVPRDFLQGDFCLDGTQGTCTLIAKQTGSLRIDVLLRTMIDTYNSALLAHEGEAVGSDVGASVGTYMDASAGSGTGACVSAGEDAGEGTGACEKGEMGQRIPLELVSVMRIAQEALEEQV